MPEVCQGVMSAHGRFHRPGNNKPLPVHQPCGLSDDSSPQCRYEWEEGRLFTLYESMQLWPWDSQQWRYLLTESPWGTAMVTNGSPLSFSGRARCLTRLTGLNPYQCIQSTYRHAVNTSSPTVCDHLLVKLIWKRKQSKSVKIDIL